MEWAITVVKEALKTSVDLAGWQQEVEAVWRFWATDAKSVFDHLTKEGTSKLEGQAMAIEGALLREALRSPNAVV
eukprot:8405144-Prorocentrum_lima.AAC.1